MGGAALTAAAREVAPAPRFDLTLGVVSHVPHWPRPDGPPRAYEPYVREMDVWGGLFARVEVCAPVAEGPPRGNLAPYSAPTIRWRPVEYSNVTEAQLLRLRQLPALTAALLRLVRSSDVVLLRSPAHPSIVARALARLVGRPTITKWAGFFGPFEGERLPSRIERAQIERGRDPALVYGPAAREHLIPFIPALMSAAELERARALGADRRWEPPWRVLSVGRLLHVKNFHLALEGLGRLRATRPELRWSYTLVGDGPEAPALRALAERVGIADRVTFTGALSFAEAQERYADAHVVIMPGVHEGWPKPIAEAWAHGAVPVAAAAGIVPWILGDQSTGRAFPPTADGLASALATLLDDPPALRAMAALGQARCTELSLESFAARVETVLVRSHGLR